MLRNISYILVGAIHTVGLLFKFMHWPGTREILVASLGGIAIVLLEYVIHKRKSKLLIRNIIYPLLGVVFVLGVLFKVMHWPFSSSILVVSMLGLSVAFAEYAYSIRKSVLTIIPTVIAIALFWSLFKIMHWPQPPYVMGICKLSFTILVPVLLLVRGYKLKQTAHSISSHLVVIAALSLIAALVDYYITFYPEGMGTGQYFPAIVYVLLVSVLLLVIKKALQIEGLKSRFQNEYGFLQCLGAIYIIVLIFQVLVS